MNSGYVSVDDSIFETLFAISMEEQQQGLMFLKNPPIMTFVYAYPCVNKYWMKNCPVDLDIVFCHKNKVSQIYRGEPFSTKSIGNDSFSDLVIEFPYGTAKSSNIKIGSPVEIIEPTINEIRKIIASERYK